ncbi:MAG: ATPase [Deltaproteobacteria bacterium]|nr:MAG: ATPase [Deltaproteobacteria bacterium]
MYLEYWGFERFPFDNVPDPDFFYLSRPHEEGLMRLSYAVERRKGCALLSGDIGCGKTTLSRVFLRRISGKKYDVALVANPCLGPKQFLQDVLYRFGVSRVPASKVEVLRVLNERLNENLEKKRETVLIVDEAQLLSRATLEEIRLLLNYQLSRRFLLTIFLLGQPELVEKIRRIRQMEQRVAIKYVLRPFRPEEIRDYIVFRQKQAGADRNVFGEGALEMIYEHSGGLPRSINNLCDLALLLGCARKDSRIEPEVIKEILDDGTIF